MALSTYGKFNKEAEKEIWDGEQFNNKFQINYDFGSKLHYNYSTEDKDIAKTFQEICEKAFLNIIKKFHIEKQFTITGGFAQNIINNTKLLKLYDVHVDPFNNDQGISLGIANWLMYNKLKKLDTVYLGFKPEYNHNFSSNFELKNIDIKSVAKLLIEEPIALFQDRSEQGQRGLGNRSLLINPFVLVPTYLEEQDYRY
jgi:predicted NodU family carbamoyl transferase